MPSLFARRRAVSAAAISRTLRQLLDLGLVEVSISPRDARQRLYRLSTKGRRVLDAVHTEREQAVSCVWKVEDAEGIRMKQKE